MVGKGLIVIVLREEFQQQRVGDAAAVSGECVYVCRRVLRVAFTTFRRGGKRRCPAGVAVALFRIIGEVLSDGIEIGLPAPRVVGPPAGGIRGGTVRGCTVATATAFPSADTALVLDRGSQRRGSFCCGGGAAASATDTAPA